MKSQDAKALLNSQPDNLQLMASDQMDTGSMRLGILKLIPMHVYHYRSTDCNVGWYSTDKLRPNPPETILIEEFDALFLQTLPEGT